MTTSKIDPMNVRRKPPFMSWDLELEALVQPQATTLCSQMETVQPQASARQVQMVVTQSQVVKHLPNTIEGVEWSEVASGSTALAYESLPPINRRPTDQYCGLKCA